MKSNAGQLDRIKELRRALGATDYMTLENILDNCDFDSCKLAFCDALMAITALEERLYSSDDVDRSSLDLLYRIAIQVFTCLVDLGSDEELADDDLVRMVHYFVAGLERRASKDA